MGPVGLYPIVAALRECLTIREKAQPDVWNTLNARSRLGAALLGQKKYAEAEALLLTGYKGLMLRETTIPLQIKNQRLSEAADRIIELYSTTNKTDDVKKWTAERAKYLPKSAEHGVNK